MTAGAERYPQHHIYDFQRSLFEQRVPVINSGETKAALDPWNEGVVREIIKWALWFSSSPDSLDELNKKRLPPTVPFSNGFLLFSSPREGDSNEIVLRRVGIALRVLNDLRVTGPSREWWKNEFFEALKSLNNRVMVVRFPNENPHSSFEGDSHQGDQAVKPSNPPLDFNLGKDGPDDPRKGPNIRVVWRVLLAMLQAVEPSLPQNIKPQNIKGVNSPPAIVRPAGPEQGVGKISPEVKKMIESGVELVNSALGPEVAYAASPEDEGEGFVVYYVPRRKGETIADIARILEPYGLKVVGFEDESGINHINPDEPDPSIGIKVKVSGGGTIREEVVKIPSYGLTPKEIALITGNPLGVLVAKNVYGGYESFKGLVEKGGERINYFAISNDKNLPPMVFYWHWQVRGGGKSLEAVAAEFNKFAEKNHLRPVRVEDLRAINPDASPGKIIKIPTSPASGYVVIVGTKENGGTKFPEGMKELYPHIELSPVYVGDATGELPDQSSPLGRLKALPGKIADLFKKRGKEEKQFLGSQTSEEKGIEEGTIIEVEVKEPISVEKFLKIVTFEANKNLPPAPPGTIWWPDIERIKNLIGEDNENAELPGGFYIEVPSNLFSLRKTEEVVDEINKIPDKLLKASEKGLLGVAKFGLAAGVCLVGATTTPSIGVWTFSQIGDRMNGWPVEDGAIEEGALATIVAGLVTYYGCKKTEKYIKCFLDKIDKVVKVKVVHGARG